MGLSLGLSLGLGFRGGPQNLGQFLLRDRQFPLVHALSVLPFQGMDQEGGDPLGYLLENQRFDQGHGFFEAIGEDPDDVQQQARLLHGDRFHRRTGDQKDAALFKNSFPLIQVNDAPLYSVYS